LTGDIFPSKNLAGVGVVFYVMMALRAALRENRWFIETGMPEPNMAAFLDLVALGTVADVVPLDKNNRILVYQGLLRIRAGKACPGIKALLQVAGKKSEQLSAADLGFAVAPRLNAAGRLVDMRIGIECLLSESSAQAFVFAHQLDGLNKERQQLEATMREQAIAELAKLKLEQGLPVGLCLFDESWHQGIIGILASRVKDLLHRPVFAFAHHNDTELKGSGRSIHGLHLKDILERISTQHPGLLIKFGGHAMAAGMSILKRDFTIFAEAFDKIVATCVEQESLQGIVYSDGELLPNAINLDTVKLLQNAGPWGQGFPEPVFDGQFKIITHRILKDKHVKFILTSLDQSFRIDAIAFNLDADKLALTGNETLHVAYRLDINDYRGSRNIQLLIEYFDVLGTVDNSLGRTESIDF
jgi:single-stranded-DNA-specific exonuclease